MTNQQANPNDLFIVRALYDFSEVQDGEICLKTNDFVQVLSQSNENWWQGKNLTDTNEPVGNFPSCFVEKINLTGLKAGETLCLSIASFRTDVIGDLAFDGNELILASKFLDENWCEGKICNGDEHLGIFPRSFIKEIYSNNLHISPKDAEEVPNESCISETREVLARGMAVLDIEASCDDELCLKDGWPVEIYELLDSDFALGRCSSPRGKIGKFPIEFILVTEGEENLKLPTAGSTSRAKFDWWKNPEVELELISKQKRKLAEDVDKIVPSFEEQTAPLTLDDEDDDIGVENEDRVSCSDSCQVLAESTKKAAFESHSHLSSDVQCDLTIKLTETADASMDSFCKSDEDKETKNGCDFQSFSKEFKTLEVIEPALIKNIDISITCPDDILTQCPVDTGLLQEDEISYVSSRNADVDSASDASAKVIIDCLSSSSVKSLLDVSLRHESFLDASNISDEGLIPINLECSIDPHNNDALKTNQEFIDEQKTDSKQPAGISERLPLANDFEYTTTADQHLSKVAELKSSDTFQLEEDSKSTEITQHAVESKPVVAPELAAPSQSASLVKPKPSAKPPILKPKPQIGIQSMVRQDGVTLLSPEITNNKSVSNVANKVEATTPKSSRSVFYVQSPGSSSVHASLWEATSVSPSSPESVLLTGDRSVTFHKIPDDSKVGLKPEDFGAVPAEREHSQSDQDCISGKSLSSLEHIKINPITGKELRPAPKAPTKDVKPVPRSVPKRPERPKNFLPNLSGSGALISQTPGFWPSGANSSNSSPVSSPGKLSMKPESSSGDNLGKMTHSSPIAPSRPAPPKPARTAPHVKPDSAKTSIQSEVDEQNSGKQVDNSIVEDIERRIMETEQDLEKCIKEQSKILEQMYENEGTHLSPEVSDDLHFFQANIQGLSDELTQLRAILKEMKPDSLMDASSSSSSMMAPQSLSTRLDEKIAKRKREEQRRKVISELLQSELDFLQGVCKCYEVFLDKSNPIKCPKSVDLDFLFGNMHEVIELSQRFYNLLEASTNGKDFHEQIIGSCFEEVGEDLKKVHSVYCRNHDEVISALTKLEANQEAQHYFDSHLDVLRKKQMVFDFGSVLIKPVQRIMKYPLLIGELIKNTEKDHPDFNHLLEADATMKEVALYINEYKRRKDLVSKYKKPTDAGFGEMIAKISIHSIKKKFNRFVTPAQSQDGRFTYEENRFKHMNLVVRNLIRDMTQYLDFFQVSLMDLESFVIDVADHCRDGEHRQDLVSLEEIYSCIYNQICAELKEKVEEVILSTLFSLLSLYQGPREIIKKRQHKLLDYDNASIRLKSTPEQERTQLMKDEVDFLRRNYEALNSQLLEDLPKLYHVSLSIVHDCLLQFIMYQHKFVKKAKEEIQKLDLFCALIQPTMLQSSTPMKSSSPPMSPLSPTTQSPTPMKRNQSSPTRTGDAHTCMTSFEIINEFTILHSLVVDKLSELSFTPVSFNPLIEEKQKSPIAREGPPLSSKSFPEKSLLIGMPQDENSLRVQTDDARSKVQSSFFPDKLYTVIEDFDGGQLLDLKLARGALVGVIKEEDPMKNKERFFVSDGVEKGFILRTFLVPRASTSTEHVVTDPRGDDVQGVKDDKDDENCNVVSTNDDNDCSGGLDNDENKVSDDCDRSHHSLRDVTGPSVSHGDPDIDTSAVHLYANSTSQSLDNDFDGISAYGQITS